MKKSTYSIFLTSFLSTYSIFLAIILSTYSVFNSYSRSSDEEENPENKWKETRPQRTHPQRTLPQPLPIGRGVNSDAATYYFPLLKERRGQGWLITGGKFLYHKVFTPLHLGRGRGWVSSLRAGSR